ncbi:MAG TPA: hypothetical protein VF174_10000 [Micromonosporaceae bacterium]
MPRTLVRAPGTNRHRSLGWLAVEWMEYFCRHGRGDVQGEPVHLGDEYAGFVVDAYAVLPNGRMAYDSAFLSRPKGCDKSGHGSRFCLFEAFGPCRFAGFAEGGEVYEDPWGLGFRYVYSPGEPMGRHVVDPFIRVLATEEEQSGNVYDSIYFNLTDDRCPLSKIPGLDAGLTRVVLPFGGEIRPSTASAASKDGGLETFACFDETHLYKTRELRDMYNTVTRNLRKRKKTAGGTWYLETTTMFAAGEDSVAERTYELAENILKGRTRRSRLLYDHRWGVCVDEDLADEEKLRAAILDAFGDAIAWNDLDGIVDEFYDPRKNINDTRRYYLNARSGRAGAYLKAPEWEDCRRPDRALRDGDLVTLGFDGSIGGPDADSTALVACRVEDGHLELLDCWEKPEDAGDDWQVDTDAVDDAVAAAMERFDVAGFYCDPPHWREFVNAWSRDYGDKMQVKASRVRPLEWWTNRPKPMSEALKRFREAVRSKALSYTPAEDRTGHEAAMATILKEHVLNAVAETTKVGGHLRVRKPYAKSPEKIDALVAAVLAWEARGDAVAAGAKPRQKVTYLPKRLR